MKLVSWNVNGLRSCLQKGFADSMRALDADVICLQETKMEPHQADIPLEGYEMVFNSAEKKGYSGTAVLTRAKPLAVSLGIGIEEHDHEGRVITLEFPDFYLVFATRPIPSGNSSGWTTACAGKTISRTIWLGWMRKSPPCSAAISMWRTGKSTSKIPPPTT